MLVFGSRIMISVFRIVAILAIATNAFADPITIPHTFTSGTRAIASEVNNNFSVLATESNAQDQRIAKFESGSLSAVADQLFCVVFFSWPIDGTAWPCTQSSDPTSIRTLTFAEVVAEGWVGTSVGGDGNNRVIFVFSK